MSPSKGKKLVFTELCNRKIAILILIVLKIIVKAEE